MGRRVEASLVSKCRHFHSTCFDLMEFTFQADVLAGLAPGKGQRLGRADHQARGMPRLSGLEAADLVARQTSPEHARRLFRQLSGNDDELAGSDSNSFHARTFIDINFSRTGDMRRQRRL